MSYLNPPTCLSRRAAVLGHSSADDFLFSSLAVNTNVTAPQSVIPALQPNSHKQSWLRYSLIASTILALHIGLWVGSQHLPAPTVQLPKPKPVVIALVTPPEPIKPELIKPKPLPPEVIKPKIPPVAKQPEPVKPISPAQPIQPEQPVVKQPVIPEPPVAVTEPVKQAMPAPSQAPEPVKAAAVPTPVPTPTPAPSQAKNEPVTEAKGYAGYLSNPAPEYPEMALERGWAGQVLLRVKVQPSGKPSEVSIKAGSGRKVLDDAAVRTVKRWMFSPALRGSTPVEGWVDVPIVFALPG